MIINNRIVRVLDKFVWVMITELKRKEILLGKEVASQGKYVNPTHKMNTKHKSSRRALYLIII